MRNRNQTNKPRRHRFLNSNKGHFLGAKDLSILIFLIFSFGSEIVEVLCKMITLNLHGSRYVSILSRTSLYLRNAYRFTFHDFVS